MLIFFEGGEWCDLDEDCLKDDRGSSKKWDKFIRFKGGILDKNVFNNRYFFDFSIIYLK